MPLLVLITLSLLAAPQAAAPAPVSLRWGFVTMAPDRAAAATQHAEAVRRDYGLGLILLHNPGSTWVRPGFELTRALERRIAGVSDTVAALPPVRRAAYVNFWELIAKTSLGRDFTARVQRLQKELGGAADAQARLSALNTQLLGEFSKALGPHVERLSREADIDVILSGNDTGIVYVSPQLDVTAALAGLMDDTAVSMPALPALRQAAYLNLQRIAAESALGKRSHAEVAALKERKAPDAEVAALGNSLTQAFEQALRPVLDRLCADRGLDVVVAQAEAGVLAADPSLDITDAVIRALDAAHR